MSHSFFLWGMRILAVISFSLMLLTLIYLSPYSDPNSFRQSVSINIMIFETSLFFALFAGFSLLLFWIRTLKSKNLRRQELNIFAGVSIRQGFLLALTVLILLIMQSFQILVWWDGLLAVGAIIMAELYFLAK
ncbi:MAG: hypothetical protein KAQ63_01720 [Candidatus Moranbacteria bacterium]|nr:hypothetical protein [Candidatus Moranbacteria bacterium]